MDVHPSKPILLLISSAGSVLKINYLNNEKISEQSILMNDEISCAKYTHSGRLKLVAYNRSINKNDNAHRYAVRWKEEDINIYIERECEKTPCNDGDTLWWQKHTVMTETHCERESPSVKKVDTKILQENVTWKY